MFKHPFRDPQMKELGKKFYFTSVPPGLKEWFLRGNDLFGYGKKGDTVEFWKEYNLT